MDLNALAFEADAMLHGLRPWVECESPTWNAAAVNRMMGLAARDLAVMGARVEPIAGRMGFGDCLRASFPHARPDQPGILVLGHLDTVHPIGTLEKLPFRRDGALCYGPGIVDMKAGNYLALEAIRQLRRAGGVIETGKWVNSVPSWCRAEALSMAKRQDDLDKGIERMLALSGVEHDVKFTVTRGVTRPVWEPSEATLAMYEAAQSLGQSIGMELGHASAGGGSDGNFTGANGIATLDGLGAEGKDYHTLNEHIEVESLCRRGRLMAGLLATLGA